MIWRSPEPLGRIVKIAPQVRSSLRKRRNAIRPFSPGNVACVGTAGTVTAATTRAISDSRRHNRVPALVVCLVRRGHRGGSICGHVWWATGFSFAEGRAAWATDPIGHDEANWASACLPPEVGERLWSPQHLNDGVCGPSAVPTIRTRSGTAGAHPGFAGSPGAMRSGCGSRRGLLGPGLVLVAVGDGRPISCMTRNKAEAARTPDEASSRYELPLLSPFGRTLGRLTAGVMGCRTGTLAGRRPRTWSRRPAP